MNEPAKNMFAKRSLGQNFLVDRSTIDRIVSAFDPRNEDIVLEIGPGHGALTQELLGRVAKLYVLEFDDALAARLQSVYGERTDFAVLHSDALEFDFKSIAPEAGKLRLIANLPYNISTAILQRLFEYVDVFSDCVLMFQREVVDRITAVPGTKARGYLSVLTEAFFHAEKLFDIRPEAFRPAPKVWSSVVRLTPHDRPIDIDPSFSRLVARGFEQKRKTILNNLRASYPSAEHALEAAGIEPRRRAETLSLDEWLRLADELEPAA